VYDGRVTPPWSRIAVLVRYGLAEAWSSRITVGLFVLAMLPVIVDLLIIYLANNPLARMMVSPGGKFPLEIDAAFFLRVLSVQCWLALVLNAWVAPRLVSFDLADNALPILLSHPISRFGYVLGKFLSLFSILSLVTWVPCLLLFAYEAYTSQQAWLGGHAQVGIGIFTGAVVWIVVVATIGLGLSSWVKWRMLATGAIFAAVFVPAGVGGVITGILRTKWGFLFNLPVMMTELWQRLIGAPEVMRDGLNLPTVAIAMMLAGAIAICVALLNARIRAREVVRG
jgi:ABC-type transport system involved in multi-copper enzyme maturation permease subunit